LHHVVEEIEIVGSKVAGLTEHPSDLRIRGRRLRIFSDQRRNRVSPK
jgi:hypothetical protein